MVQVSGFLQVLQQKSMKSSSNNLIGGSIYLPISETNMAKRLGVFLDVNNLYYCLNKQYNRRKLDYEKYLEFLQDLGELQTAIAYGTQVNNQARGFIHCLRQTGYQTKFKTIRNTNDRQPSWDVGITIDVVNMADRLDLVVIGSANRDLLPVVAWCMDRGLDVIVVACGIAKELKQRATSFIEIPASLLEDQESKSRRQREMDTRKDLQL